MCTSRLDVTTPVTGSLGVHACGAPGTLGSGPFSGGASRNGHLRLPVRSIRTILACPLDRRHMTTSGVPVLPSLESSSLRSLGRHGMRADFIGRSEACQRESLVIHVMPGLQDPTAARCASRCGLVRFCEKENARIGIPLLRRRSLPTREDALAMRMCRPLTLLTAPCFNGAFPPLGRPPGCQSRQSPRMAGKT